MVDIMAAINTLKTAFDTVRGLKDINDASVRNSVILELQEKILTAQGQQGELVDEIKALQAKLAAFDTWATEAKRYQLTDFGGETFAYVLKKDCANGEPIHYLCPTCFQQSRKSILQARGVSAHKQQVFHCNTCNTDIFLGVRQALNVQTPRAPSYFGRDR